MENLLSIGEQVFGMPHESPGMAYKWDPVRQNLGLVGIENGDSGKAPKPPSKQDRSQSTYD